MEQNVLFEQTVAYLSMPCRKRLSMYLRLLRQACIEDPPPYGESGYADGFVTLSDNSEWFASLLLSYAEEEAIGAERLIRLSRTVEKLLPRAKSFVMKHAQDETRHVLVFLKVLRALFPQFRVSPEAREALERRHSNLMQPQSLGGEFRGDLLSEFSQINIGEVKNRVHLSMLRDQALKHCCASNLKEVEFLTSSLIKDEVNHIVYTGTVLQFIASSCGYEDATTRYVDVFSAFNRQLRAQTQSHIQSQLAMT